MTDNDNYNSWLKFTVNYQCKKIYEIDPLSQNHKTFLSMHNILFNVAISWLSLICFKCYETGLAFKKESNYRFTQKINEIDP